MQGLCRSKQLVANHIGTPKKGRRGKKGAERIRVREERRDLGTSSKRNIITRRGIRRGRVRY